MLLSLAQATDNDAVSRLRLATAMRLGLRPGAKVAVHPHRTRRAQRAAEHCSIAQEQGVAEAHGTETADHLAVEHNAKYGS